MNNRNILQAALILILAVFAGPGCRDQGKPPVDEGEFFSGKFVVNSDGQPMFTDCATYVTMEVDVNEKYESIRKKYSYIGLVRGEEIAVEFAGKVGRHEHERENKVNSNGLIIRIDSILNIYKNRDCISDYIIPGIYQADINDNNTSEKISIRLKPDYTYTYSRFKNDGSEISGSGTWHRSSLMIIVLADDIPGSNPETFQIFPARESMSRNSGGKPLELKKVYL